MNNKENNTRRQLIIFAITMIACLATGFIVGQTGARLAKGTFSAIDVVGIGLCLAALFLSYQSDMISLRLPSKNESG